jgi:hypothetical protein
MPEVADYSALEQLRDRRPIKIRALRPEDRTDMLTAIGRASMQSPQWRFFVPKKVAREQHDVDAVAVFPIKLPIARHGAARLNRRSADRDVRPHGTVSTLATPG